MPRRLLPSLLLTLFLIPLPALAQGPSADWRTLSTVHFRVHYPAESEAWARHAAERLEAIWERVGAEVGYRPEEVVEVLVSDPAAEANGAAFPILGWPRLWLWTSPPGPESVIGHYSDWSELLLVHEAAHLAHLLRPSRNPLQRGLGRLLPVGPVARKVPRWVTEGYATVVEGRLTASGRPNGDLRAALLRRRAQLGRLPSYGALDGDESWFGSSMAYLMGSAYLEWLDGRAGPGSLPKLWARLSARRERSFDAAFRGVYGASPAELYGRFTAELTHGALEVERRLGAPTEGALWLDLSWSTGEPALSPDGSRLALVRTGRDRPAELVVWSTAVDEKAVERWQKERAEIAERDPEDVPAVETGPPPHEILHRLPAFDGRAPSSPRFLPGGEDLLFVRFEPNGEGFLHPDLFRWETSTGRVERLTREADVRSPDPAPDGHWAAAVRHRHGLSQLVRVDLATGDIAPITEPSLAAVVDQPRVSPDGERLVYARHRSGSQPDAGIWELVVRDLASGAETPLALPAGATAASPAWAPDGGTVYAVLGNGGFLDVWALPADGSSPPRPVTRTAGAALAPAPTPDGQALFYLALQADGLDLHRLELAGTEAGATAGASSTEVLQDFTALAPAVRPVAPPLPTPFAVADVAPSTPYGLGRPEMLPFFGGFATSAGAAAELGLRVGDLVGRFDALLLGAAGDGTFGGGALAAAWRGSPVEVSFHLFSVAQSPSQQDRPLPGFARGADFDRQGLELRALWDRQRGPAYVRLGGGLLAVESRSPGRRVERDTVGFLDGAAEIRKSRGRWWWEPGLSAHWEQGDGWDRAGGLLNLGLGRDDQALRLRWRREELSGRPPAAELLRLGGVATSLLPRSALAGRIVAPALPEATLLGDTYEGQRAGTILDFLPVPLFAERHRLDFGPRSDRSGDWFTLAGLEGRWTLGPIPLVRLPALDVRAGVARVLEEPSADELFEDDWRWWASAVWRP